MESNQGVTPGREVGSDPDLAAPEGGHVEVRKVFVTFGKGGLYPARKNQLGTTARRVRRRRTRFAVIC